MEIVRIKAHYPDIHFRDNDSIQTNTPLIGQTGDNLGRVTNRVDVGWRDETEKRESSRWNKYTKYWTNRLQLETNKYTVEM